MTYRHAKRENTDRGPPPKIDYEAIVHEALTEPGKLHERYSAFWNYSIGNQWLASIQLGRLEPINTFPGWKALGRYVKRDEKAIALLMPIMVKAKDEVTGAEEDGKKRIFVAKNHWFGLHQTDGEEYKPVVPGFDFEQACKNLDIQIETFQHGDGNCQGYAKTAQKIIAVSPIAFDKLKTGFHEFGHVKLEHGMVTMHAPESIPKDVREVEAELVAYLGKSALGLTSGLEYSRGYIANWMAADTKEKIRYPAVFKAVDDLLKAGHIDAEPTRPTINAAPLERLEA